MEMLKFNHQIKTNTTNNVERAVWEHHKETMGLQKKAAIKS